MSDVVFIAGKSKSAYFQRAAVELVVASSTKRELDVIAITVCGKLFSI